MPLKLNLMPNHPEINTNTFTQIIVAASDERE